MGPSLRSFRSSSGTSTPSSTIAPSITPSIRSSTSSHSTQSSVPMGPKSCSPFKVLIVGAGVGGLMLGHCLERAGFDYTILEKSTEEQFMKRKTTIQLAANTLRAMEQLGLLEEVMKISKPVSSIVLRKANMSIVGKIDALYTKERYGHHSCLVQRTEFCKILMTQMTPGRILWGQKVLEIVSGNSGVQCRCANGHVEPADILVGADGGNSPVRQNLYRSLRDKGLLPKIDQEPLRYTQNAIIGMTEPLDVGQFPEAGDKFSEVNIVVGKDSPYTMWISPASDNQVVWSVTGELMAPITKDENFRVSEFGPEAIDDACRLVHHLESPYGGTLGDLIARTKKENISKILIEEKHYKTWFYGRTVLLGEACHKFVPFSGQGAEQAIQDAICLVNHLYRLENNYLGAIVSAFEQYQEERSPAAKTAVQVSNHMSNLMNSHGFSAEVKRRVVFNMPSWVKAATVDKIQVRPLLDFLPAVDDRGSKAVSLRSA